MKKRLPVFLLILSLILINACSGINQEDFIFTERFGSSSHNSSPQRESSGVQQVDKVFILFSLGFNNLSSNLKEDISEMESGCVPNKWEDKIALVFSHAASSNRDFTTQVHPVLYRVYAEGGMVVRDTLKVYPLSCVSADAGTIKDVFDMARTLFVANSYGAVVSSHASGWLPYDPDKKSGYSTMWEGGFWSAPGTSPKPGREERWQEVPTKSVGVQGSYSNGAAYQINIEDFAAAIPMKLDYLIFDACLCGGVEVYYALKEKCRYIAASPTETLTDGHVYTTILRNLLYSKDTLSGLETCCQEYFEMYDSRTGWNRSATIAIYDCAYAQELATAVKNLLEKYSDILPSIDKSKVQDYNYNYDEFFDLRDIFAAAGAGKEELSDLDAALLKCVPFKAATPVFINTTIDPQKYSGMSMYLPYEGRTVLAGYYKQLSWNKAVLLLK